MEGAEAMTRRAWTPEEVTYLREQWQTMSWLAIAEKLGRSHATVRSKASALGLRKLSPARPKPTLARKKNISVIVQPTVRFGAGGPARMAGDPVITDKTRKVSVGAPIDQRYAPERAASVIDPAECRPWARWVMK